MNLGEWATLYASRGWPVFPLVPGTKRPACINGFKDAATDPRRVQQWWTEQPECNIGLATGHAFDVFDIDHIGYREDSLDAFGLGPTVITPSGGYHVYMLPGRRNRVRFMPGADWRGIGGYVVAPPSWSDERQANWAWVNADLAIPEVPTWLTAALDWTPQRPCKQATLRRGGRPYVKGALASAERLIERAPIGERNNTLNYQAWCLSRFVLDGALELEELTDCLVAAAVRAGLDHGEALRTISSASRSRGL